MCCMTIADRAFIPPTTKELQSRAILYVNTDVSHGAQIHEQKLSMGIRNL